MLEEDWAVPRASFRDPAGSVQIRSDCVHRSIRASHAQDTLSFLRSNLQSSLVSEGKLVASAIVSHTDQTLELQHPLLPFISYPSEWPLTLWNSAALLTLEICTRLIASGRILKDATPLNVVLLGTCPVFVDIASIESLDTSSSTWAAYGQFVRTFMLPMLAHTELGWPLQTTQLRRDGFEPEELYRALPSVRRLKSAAFSSVTLPILAQRFLRPRSAGLGEAGSRKSFAPKFADPEINRQVLTKRISGLRATLGKVRSSRASGYWTDYAAGVGHYATEDQQRKRTFVLEILRGAQSVSVLDIGCNTGDYSRLAAEAGARVVSVDSDAAALDRFAGELGQQTAILPLCVDIAHPTPATGWENRETVSFLDRARGHFDTVFMLAVIHHLLLSSQIPMGHIAQFCYRLEARNLVIEWVPPTDPKFIEVLRGRDMIYQHVTEALFRESFSKYFSFRKQLVLSNGRSLFHLEKAK